MLYTANYTGLNDPLLQIFSPKFEPLNEFAAQQQLCKLTILIKVNGLDCIKGRQSIL